MRFFFLPNVPIPCFLCCVEILIAILCSGRPAAILHLHRPAILQIEQSSSVRRTGGSARINAETEREVLAFTGRKINSVPMVLFLPPRYRVTSPRCAHREITIIVGLGVLNAPLSLFTCRMTESEIGHLVNLLLK